MWLSMPSLHALALQHAVDPEPVEPRFLNDDQPHHPPSAGAHLVPELGAARQQPGDVTAAQLMLRHLLAAARRQRGHQPSRTAQLERDEDCAKIGADRDLLAVTVILGHWSSPVWLVRQPTPSEPIPSHLHRIYMQVEAMAELLAPDPEAETLRLPPLAA
jgi:hypothetical protein